MKTRYVLDHFYRENKLEMRMHCRVFEGHSDYSLEDVCEILASIQLFTKCLLMGTAIRI